MSSEPMYCQTCRTALNQLRDLDGARRWVHVMELRTNERADHSPVPVPLSQLADPVTECDFCSQRNPHWVYTGANQITKASVVTSRTVRLGDYRDRHDAARTMKVETAPGLTQSWGEKWAACNDCASLIDVRDVLGLVARVTDALPVKVVRGKKLIRVRGELIDLYTKLFASLLPGRGEITRQAPDA